MCPRVNLNNIVAFGNSLVNQYHTGSLFGAHIAKNNLVSSGKDLQSINN